MFETIEKLPADPILGLTAAFKEDANPKKVDLGAGVYKDEAGNTPIFAAVKLAESQWQQEENTKAYTPQPGFADFNEHIQPFIFGKDHPALSDKRMTSIMAPGGSGALRVGSELLKRCQPGATLWVSTPTWGNHVPLLGTSGLKIEEYPYYNPATHSLRFEEMLNALKKLGKNDIVLLHGCCHNPSGVDLSHEQWDAVAETALTQGFLPFIDTAYHGLGDGLDEDAYGIRLLSETVPETLVVYSCSKNFGLYRERIGVAIAVGATNASAENSLSHMTNIARTMYSLPPSHGGAIVKTILADSDLYSSWNQELDEMRGRINHLRSLLADTLTEKNAPTDFNFIKDQRGMFSFLGISKEQVQRLRDEYSIYMVGSSRINVAGINSNNIDYLTDAIVAVL